MGNVAETAGLGKSSVLRVETSPRHQAKIPPPSPLPHIHPAGFLVESHSVPRAFAFLIALATMLSLASCATHSPDPLAAQRKVYEEQLLKIEPGMTRRQLYAVLPPSSAPEVTPAGFSGAIISIPLYDFHAERHPLGDDFDLRVEYRRVEVRRYLDRYYAACRKATPRGIALPLKSYPRIQFTKLPDMNDQLAVRPILMQRGVQPKTISLPRMGTLEELATPPRKS